MAIVTADILVLAVTWLKTFRQRMEASRIGMQTPLSNMLLRDGLSFHN